MNEIDAFDAIRARTPARLFVGRSGPGYRTATQLGLRADHAAARDAVHESIDAARDLAWAPGLLALSSCARTKQEYLMRADLGRRLDDSRRRIAGECPAGVDLQIVLGDGLSPAALLAQGPGLLAALTAGAAGWSLGRVVFVRHCRVGILNDVGDLLGPEVVVLLIGERPGLMTAESLSAYLAYRPRAGDTDERRNLISNIHARGVGVDQAAPRILALAARMREARAGGVGVKEALGDRRESLP
jgi:ethanolamine ammonia-lyase small subunit